MKQISILYFLFFLSISAYAQQISKADELFVDSIMNASYKHDAPGAVILISKKGEPIFRKAYGLANMELNIPNKPENIFSIGSISKQFTSVCILKLAQEGKLSLQDDIKKYLSEYNSHGRHITIENLLNQTSGITSYTEMKGYFLKSMIDQSEEEMINFFMNDSLLFEPGTDWSYSNSNYILAGIIIEKVSGKPLTEFYTQNIFTPLEMSNTSVGSHDTIIANAASGYRSADAGKYKPAVYESRSWDLGCGGIISCVDDMLKWDNALYTDKIVKQEWLKKAWNPFLLPNGKETNYGLGWGISNYNGLQIIQHSGAIPGFMSDGFRIPSQQLYISILTNNEAVGPWDISTDVAMRLTGQKITKSTIVKINKKDLNEYTGVYQIHRVGSRIATNYTDEKLYRYNTIEGDSLFSQPAGGSKEVLLCIGKNLFVGEESDTRFLFNRNKKGDITSLEMYTEPLTYGPNEIELKTNLPLPKKKVALALDVKTLEQFKGKYSLGGGDFILVSVADNKIYIQETGEKKQEIFAENETKFFLKSIDATIEFKKENGKVTCLVLNQAGKTAGKKVE